MEDILGDLEKLFDEFDVNDELVENNHKFIERLNKKSSHKIKKPAEYGVKAS
ncbi:hypothetical protein ISS05_04630 [Candidatus Woesearchaeota archaeon]|nr:hypothetical protein [Candidatus Woesearchaeota archaeon]